MTIEATIFTRLGPLVGNRCYPDVIPQAADSPKFPQIVYSRISATPGEDLDGDGGDETADVRMQLDIYAQSYGAAKTLRDQVKNAMADFDPPEIWDAERWIYEAETKTHRCILDYLFYPSSEQA